MKPETSYKYVPWTSDDGVEPYPVPAVSLRMIPMGRDELVRVRFHPDCPPDYLHQEVDGRQAFLWHPHDFVLQHYKRAVQNLPACSAPKSDVVWVECDFRTDGWYWHGDHYGIDNRIRNSWMGERLLEPLERSGRWPRIRTISFFTITARSTCEFEKALVYGLQEPPFPPKDKWRWIPLGKVESAP